MDNKVNEKNIERRNNNIARPIYFISFIIALVLVSIAYASLAINLGVKVNSPKKTEPVDNKVEPTPSPTPSPTPAKTPTIIPRRPDPEPEVVIPDDINWKIQFENIVVDEDSIEPLVDAYITDSKTEVIYQVELSEPGEFYSFEVSVVNRGNIDARIYNIVEQTITERQKQYLDYSVTYSDGTPIKINDTLLEGQTKKITVMLRFKDDLNAEDLPDEAQDLKLSYRIEYVEK